MVNKNIILISSFILLSQIFLSGFIYSAFAGSRGKIKSTDINTPSKGETYEIVPYKEYNLLASGTEFGCHESNCKGRFAYVEITGDFDVWCRVTNVANLSGHCAAAGLMARANTSPDATFVKIVANSHNRYWNEYDPFVMGVRYRKGGHLPQDDSWLGGYWYCIPENFVNKDIAFPNCWVRLVRKGKNFTGYFAQTAGEPTEKDWNEFPITFALGEGPSGPTFVDQFNAFPDKLYVGICLEPNVEGDPKHISVAGFKDIHGLTPLK